MKIRNKKFVEKICQRFPQRDDKSGKLERVLFSSKVVMVATDAGADDVYFFVLFTFFPSTKTD